uniref:FHF complex subunit HOOK-interacting protein C-terminal domain-containing protein n=1 Tax=Timema cristinae TaxID=61476 RepID=A0A7R9CB05_TIMCR|nr:unnamed protein product [Timema cristinae]
MILKLSEFVENGLKYICSSVYLGAYDIEFQDIAALAPTSGLAPPAPLREDFVYHWRMITKFYVNKETATRVVVESTNIPAHLDQLIKVSPLYSVSYDNLMPMVDIECSNPSPISAGTNSVHIEEMGETLGFLIEMTEKEEEDDNNGASPAVGLPPACDENPPPSPSQPQRGIKSQALILEEQCSLEEGATGPCLEYLLQHHILDLLATLACTDSPPGMKSLTLCFMKKLLTQLREPVLPHVSVYAPVQYVETKRLSVSSTTSSQSSGFEDFKFPPSPQYRHNDNENLEHPPLIREDALEQTKPELMTETFTFQSSPETKSPNWGSTNKFPLLDALLSFLHSADSRVTVKACEGIMLLAALPSDSFARSLARHSNLCAELAARLAALYEGIVPDVDPNDIDEMQITWGLYYQMTQLARVYRLYAQMTQLAGVYRFYAQISQLVRIYRFYAQLYQLARVYRFYAQLYQLARVYSLDSLAWTDGTKFLGCRQVAAFLAWLDYFDQCLAAMKSYLGCRQVAAFLAWLDYFDQLVREAHPITGTTLAECFRSQFLEGVLGPTLLETGSSTILATAFITKCLKQVTAPALLQADVHGRESETRVNRRSMQPDALGAMRPCAASCAQLEGGRETGKDKGRGESREPELPNVITCPIRRQLFDNCFHEQDEVSLETLRLFEVLLEKPSEHSLHCLVLTYLNSRRYYDTLSSDLVIGSWSDEEEERERNNRDSPTLDFSEGPSPVSRTLAPGNIDKIINSFLLLLPQPLHSATDPGDEGYEQYVQDADRQYQECVTRCSRHSWPNEATFPDLMEGDDSHSSDSRPEADHDGNGARNFYEGPFLRMLFTRLVRLPYQPYEINLQLTSLVSRLAMLPHPYLHEYLLNPLLPVLPGTNTLFGTLELVAAELVTQIPLLKSYKQALYATRQRLLEGICDPQGVQQGAVCYSIRQVPSLLLSAAETPVPATAREAVPHQCPLQDTRGPGWHPLEHVETAVQGALSAGTQLRGVSVNQTKGLYALKKLKVLMKTCVVKCLSQGYGGNQIDSNPPSSEESSHNKFWILERLLSSSLLVICPLAFLIPSVSMDCVLATTLVLHNHWGCEAALRDYLRPDNVGKFVAGAARGLIYVLSIAGLTGLLFFNTNDKGIVECLEMIWHMETA